VPQPDVSSEGANRLRLLGIAQRFCFKIVVFTHKEVAKGIVQNGCHGRLRLA
jgi:hypothetical protein